MLGTVGVASVAVPCKCIMLIVPRKHSHGTLGDGIAFLSVFLAY